MLPKIEVALGEPINTITGFEWPQENGTYLHYTAAEGDHHITVVLPGGLRFTELSRITFFSQLQNRPASIILTVSDGPRDFHSRVKRLRKVAESLGIGDRKEVKDMFAEWETETPHGGPFDTHTLMVDVEGGTVVSCDLMSHWDGKEDWYISLSFDAAWLFERALEGMKGNRHAY